MNTIKFGTSIEFLTWVIDNKSSQMGITDSESIMFKLQ
jgi:hypothetical protein